MDVGNDAFLNKFEKNIYPKNSTPLLKSNRYSESGYSTGLSVTSESDFDQSLPDSFKPKSFSFDEKKEYSNPHIPKHDIILFKSLNNSKIPIITLTPTDEEKKNLANELNKKKCFEQNSNFLTVSLPELNKLYPVQNDLLSFINHSCPLVISLILSYLSPNDLTALCVASKTHQTIVIEHKKANKRRLTYLNKIRNLKHEIGQENWPMKKPLARIKYRGILVNVENFENNVESNRLNKEKQAIKLNENKIVNLKKRKNIYNLIEHNYQSNKVFQESKKIAQKQNLSQQVEKSNISSKKIKVKKEAKVGNSISKRNLKRL